jgi:hypothetical protein
MHQSKTEKTLAGSYELLLYLVEKIIPIQEELEIGSNHILAVVLRSFIASTDISFGKLYKLFEFLEKVIGAIQDELGIVGYTSSPSSTDSPTFESKK